MVLACGEWTYLKYVPSLYQVHTKHLLPQDVPLFVHLYYHSLWGLKGHQGGQGLGRLTLL